MYQLLGDVAPQPQPTAADVLAALTDHNNRMFWLSVVSTAAVSISALFALYRNHRLLRRELARKKAK